MISDENNNVQLKLNKPKSKERVRDHGEVFTSEREVNAILDLVKNETERIESKFLEPACGDGNFLVEILRRKLDIVKERYKRSKLEFERNSISALTSVYGIDILMDNVESCRSRLLDIFIDYYRSTYKIQPNLILIESVKFILGRNILWGDALNLRTPELNSKPIIFTEWTRPFNDSRIKRREYYFHELTESESKDLFESDIISDIGEKGFIPRPIKDYPLIHFLKLLELK